jgi:ABC-2 type transport system permease protein
MSEFLWQLGAAFVITKKNMKVYYLKPPVFTFGIIFPLFFYLAFAAGHNAPPETMAPGIVAMALFFTASAVGPLVTPWERQARTYERLITSPASLGAILAGDVMAGATFGVVLALLPLAITQLLTPASVVAVLPLVLGVVLGALSFAGLGVLIAAPPTNGPSQVMMVSNLVRLPLIFVSGVFVPFSQMPGWGRSIAPFSPLSYSADLIRAGFGEEHYWTAWTDALVLTAFIAGFMLLAARVHQRTR